jgi:hypothetical protein
VGLQATGLGTVPTLALDGPGRARGRIHGESLRGMIHDGIGRWKDALARGLTAPPDAYIRELVTRTSFTAAIRRWAPDLGEEVEGLAEGAGVDRETMLAYQLVDEEWWFRRGRAPATGEPEKCSVVGHRGAQHGAPLLAQNLDVPAWCDGLLVTLLITRPDSDIQALVFSYAGLIALTGINNGPLAVCVNALLQLDHSPSGLPVAFVVREALARAGVESAARFLRSIDHASGQAYSLAGARRIAGYECSASACRRFFPAAGAPALCHTNHPVAGDGGRRSGDAGTAPDGGAGAASRTNTERRLEQLVSRTRALDGPPTARDIAATLRSHDHPEACICAHGGDQLAAFTAWSVIYEPTAPPRVSFTAGPPCRSEYRTAELAGRRR